MSKQVKQQETLQHLRSLAHQLDEQVRYALEILERERSKQVVSEALGVLTQAPVPHARPILLQLYAYYDEAGIKRDAGGDLRTTLLSALLPLADTRDQTLAERAITTYARRMRWEPACSGTRSSPEPRSVAGKLSWYPFAG